MSNGAYDHYRIGQGILIDFNSESLIDIKITPKLGVNKLLTFIYDIKKINSMNESESLPEISVGNDTIIKITLSDDVMWRWSTKYDAITTKQDLKYLYGNLKYLKSDATDDYDIITFDARFNRFGQMGTRHEFNLNVEFAQRTGSAPLWLQVTIDPDIPNPPPPREAFVEGEDKVLYSYI